MSSKKSAANLPQTNNTYYVFCKLLRTWVADEGEEPVRPYLFVIVDMVSKFILNAKVLKEEPTAAEALEIILGTMIDPQDKKIPKQRPKAIKFEDKGFADEISKSLSEIGIAGHFAPNRRLSTSIAKDFLSLMDRDEPEIKGLSSDKGITPTILKGFYQAAAEFFRAEPWVYLTDNNILKIRIPASTPHFVSIMGQAGMEYGMIVFKTWEDLESFYLSQSEEVPAIPKDGLHSFSFESKYNISFDDLDDIELHKFEIAAKNAYPFPMIYYEDGGYERPPLKMIIWYQGAFQAVARFVALYFKSEEAVGQKEKMSFQFKVNVGKNQVEAEIVYPVDGVPNVGYVPPSDHTSPMEMMGFGGIGHDDSQLREAQEIIHGAWEEIDPDKRVELAQQALEISENCVDAYILLADDFAATNQEKLKYYQKGTEAGEQFLGEEYFEESQGHFWGLIETRPYMRALAGQANCLWVIGERQLALETWRRMLTLNPGDNQGIRYLLLSSLLEMGKYQDAEALIKEYENSKNADWLFTKALLKYKDAGPTTKANKLLTEAHEYNPFVKTYLIGEKRIPQLLPHYQGFGDENEAIMYADSHLNHWRMIPGAVDWLKSTISK